MGVFIGGTELEMGIWFSNRVADMIMPKAAVSQDVLFIAAIQLLDSPLF